MNQKSFAKLAKVNKSLCATLQCITFLLDLRKRSKIFSSEYLPSRASSALRLSAGGIGSVPFCLNLLRFSGGAADVSVVLDGKSTMASKCIPKIYLNTIV